MNMTNHMHGGVSRSARIGKFCLQSDHVKAHLVFFDSRQDLIHLHIGDEDNGGANGECCDVEPQPGDVREWCCRKHDISHFDVLSKFSALGRKER